MIMKFERPTISLIEQEKFSMTEVGITHQFTDAYVRLTDDGDVEIVAAPGLAIVLHPQNRSITFVADRVKFMTKDENGMLWNDKSFNPQATKFTEPAFLPFDMHEGFSGAFSGIDDFLD